MVYGGMILTKKFQILEKKIFFTSNFFKVITAP